MSANPLSLAASCFVSMSSLILVLSAGCLLTYKGTLNANTNRALSVGLTRFAWPLYVFWKVAGILGNTENFISVYPLLLNPFITLTFSFPFVYAYSVLAKPPPQVKEAMMTAIAFTADGLVTIMIGSDVCGAGGALHGDPKCDYLNGYNMLQNGLTSLCFWVGVPLFIKREAARNAKGDNPHKDLSFCSQFLLALKGPVPLSTFAAVVFIIIPGVKELFFLVDSPLASVRDACESVGYYGLVGSQLGLGSMLVILIQQSDLADTGFVKAAAFFRNIVISLSYTLAVVGVMHLGVMADDRVMAFVVLMNVITPCGFGVLFIGQQSNHAESELAYTMVLSYTSSLVTMPFCLYVFFTLIP